VAAAKQRGVFYLLAQGVNACLCGPHSGGGFFFQNGTFPAVVPLRNIGQAGFPTAKTQIGRRIGRRGPVRARVGNLVSILHGSSQAAACAPG